MSINLQKKLKKEGTVLLQVNWNLIELKPFFCIRMCEHPSDLAAKQPIDNAIVTLPKVYVRKRKKSIDEHNSTTPVAKY